jgi:hypothetical protein
MRFPRSTVFVALGVVLLTTTLVASATTAPTREVARDGSAVLASDSRTTTTAANDSADPGGVLVAIQGGGPQWQRNGQVYLLRDGERVWSVSDRDSYFDATRMDNGNVVAGFHNNDYESGCDPYDPPCTKTGFRVIDPDAEGGPATVSEYTFPIRSPTHREVHDVEPIGEDSFVFTDMEHERVVVVSDGEVEWEWRAAESGFYDAPPDPTTTDWLHINDVDYLGDDRFLVSVRNANQIVVIERGEGVVDVINEDRSAENDDACDIGGQLQDYDGDGEIRCGNPDVMNHQHNPQWLGDGALLVADSENDRIVELHRQENGTWRPAWALEEANGIDLNWPRDADRLPNGNTLVTDSLKKRIFEVNRSGGVVWSNSTELIPYEADLQPEGELTGPYTPNATAESDGGAITNDTDATDGTNATTTASDPDLRYEQSERVQTSDDDVPVLSLALVGIRAVFPKLPFWFGELQLVLTALSLGLIAGGGIDRYRNG